MPPGDKREEDVRRFISEHYADITQLTFTEDSEVTSPHVVSLEPVFHEHETSAIGAALFRHFNPIV